LKHDTSDQRRVWSHTRFRYCYMRLHSNSNSFSHIITIVVSVFVSMSVSVLVKLCWNFCEIMFNYLSIVICIVWLCMSFFLLYIKRRVFEYDGSDYYDYNCLFIFFRLKIWLHQLRPQTRFLPQIIPHLHL
jgi:uncharacterized protein YqhQ